MNRIIASQFQGPVLVQDDKSQLRGEEGAYSQLTLSGLRFCFLDDLSLDSKYVLWNDLLGLSPIKQTNLSQPRSEL